jgi:preprotein translocase subunit Sec61beta
MKSDEKKRAKQTKAQVKHIQDEAKAKAKAVKAEGKLRAQRLRSSSLNGGEEESEPRRISIDVHEVGGYSELVISGLKREQLQRLLPQINRDVLITQAYEKSAFKAGLLRFFREGSFQTAVKVVAGLIVGLLLYKFGLK